jgi:hypothetical protein
MRFIIQLVFCCTAATAPLNALAQQGSTRPDPAAPGAAVAPLKYESAFTGYAPFRDQPPASWRELNDEVARVGGHLGILRGASGHGSTQPAAPASSQGIKK